MEPSKYICISFKRREYEIVKELCSKYAINVTSIVKMYTIEELKKFLANNESDEIVLTFKKTKERQEEKKQYKSHTVSLPVWVCEEIDKITEITNMNQSEFIKYLIIPVIKKKLEE